MLIWEWILLFALKNTNHKLGIPEQAGGRWPCWSCLRSRCRCHISRSVQGCRICSHLRPQAHHPDFWVPEESLPGLSSMSAISLVWYINAGAWRRCCWWCTGFEAARKSSGLVLPWHPKSALHQRAVNCTLACSDAALIDYAIYGHNHMLNMTEK